jgi:toxin ParE1/3/4
MKFKIHLTLQAENDLRGIYEYIAFSLWEPEIASKQLDRIETGILSLDEMPDRFRVFENDPWKNMGLRQMAIDNYIVFYTSDYQVHVVNIIRILYGGRDIAAQLSSI